MYFKPLPSAETICLSLTYDPVTGVFTRNSTGEEAGSKKFTKKGKRLCVTIDVGGVRYVAHRLAWMIATGEDPNPLSVDHINRDPWDNKFANLRLADHTLQQANRNGWGLCEHIGVSFYKPTKRWRARVVRYGETTALGYFPTMEDAVLARKLYLERNPDKTGTIYN
jgi:hypothetical protein